MLNLVPKVGADLSLFKINVSGQRVKLREINEQHCNPGFQHIWQCVDVSDYEGKGEDEPLPDVFNNLGEAEYIVSVFQYMIILGYKPQHISIITPFNGQKHLIVDIMRKRCMDIGLPMPGQILTFDAAQGMQNEFVLVSLVRTNGVDGYLADSRNVNRIMSHARRGLYVFGCKDNFLKNSYSKIWTQLWKSSPGLKLDLCFGEQLWRNDPKFVHRRVLSPHDKDRLHNVSSVNDMLSITEVLLRLVR
uniref:DNA2/NAM7 helicase-like C-terminal domain-containing protein n=2 Tax=Aplanochytrium stocchinoi TaxID=215587 RepID=A0A7S3LKN3_9STRA|mmetsp:Transcript_16479/g.18643  ORF Transcript_16479/g.18643 Transcript_16479/m.18643 type:complete len:247 (+) Transcript_16479:153-893(+)